MAWILGAAVQHDRPGARMEAEAHLLCFAVASEFRIIRKIKIKNTAKFDSSLKKTTPKPHSERRLQAARCLLTHVDMVQLLGTDRRSKTRARRLPGQVHHAPQAINGY